MFAWPWPLNSRSLQLRTSGKPSKWDFIAASDGFQGCESSSGSIVWANVLVTRVERKAAGLALHT